VKREERGEEMDILARDQIGFDDTCKLSSALHHFGGHTVDDLRNDILGYTVYVDTYHQHSSHIP
jgi:hypothetical protein